MTRSWVSDTRVAWLLTVCRYEQRDLHLLIASKRPFMHTSRTTSDNHDRWWSIGGSREHIASVHSQRGKGGDRTSG